MQGASRWGPVGLHAEHRWVSGAPWGVPEQPCRPGGVGEGVGWAGQSSNTRVALQEGECQRRVPGHAVLGAEEEEYP